MTKTKKNLRPQQVAPVQRETPANSSQGEGLGLHPSMGWEIYRRYPFAGDDAE